MNHVSRKNPQENREEKQLRAAVPRFLQMVKKIDDRLEAPERKAKNKTEQQKLKARAIFARQRQNESRFQALLNQAVKKQAF